MDTLPPEIIADFRITLNRFSKMVAGIPERDPGEDRAVLAALKVEMSRCSRCALSHSGSRTAPIGNPSAPVVILDLDGMVTRDAEALELLTRMFSAIGIEKESLYISSVYKCSPLNIDEMPQPVVCTGFLDRELQLTSPALLCVLGGEAATALTGDDRDITFLHGRKLSYRSFPLFTIRHPHFLLNNPEYKKEAWADLQIIRDFYNRAAGRVLS